MLIRPANQQDKAEIVALYKRSQKATGLPSPDLVAPNKLGEHLYARDAIGRYVAVEDGVIVGHGLIQKANPEHHKEWLRETKVRPEDLIEIGGAFVEPYKTGKGIWSSLLDYRLNIVRNMGAVPVSATWSVNEHVKRHFINIGGREIAQKNIKGGTISLFVL